MDKRLYRLSFFLVVIMFVVPVNIYAQQKGDIILMKDFSDQADIDDWEQSGRAKVINKEGVTSVRIHSGILKYYLPLDKIKGTKLSVKYNIRAKDVSTRPQPWNGIKVMVHVVLPWEDVWQQADLPDGSFDWREGGFYAYIPDEATAVELITGMEEVSGRVWLDRIEVTVAEAPRKVNAEYVNTGKLITGHSESRLRGMMVSPLITDSDLIELAKWKVNLVRWQITWNGFPYSPADTATAESYLAWHETILKRIDAALPLCRKLGIKVVIDLHTLPGGLSGNTMVHKLFQNKEWQDVFREVWLSIAKRYKNEAAVWGYDLANEPNEGIVPDGVMDWRQLATITAMDIKAVDNNKAIIFEAAPGGTQQALSAMEPLPVQGIVYSFHMYTPPRFTLQNLNGGGQEINYPGTIDGKQWDIATIRKALSALVKWQKDYNVPIYVGEFSAIRWAPQESAYYYMNDCIRVFEEMGWDWSYHAFREWDGWSVEHDGNKDNNQPAKQLPERKKLLLEWFEKNER